MGAQDNGMPVLDVRNLKTVFRTQDGPLPAVDGVSLKLDAGETLGLVGESGSGKSVTNLSILRLIPNPPGRIEEGQVRLKDVDLLKLSDEKMRQVRGKRVAMIFQDPMTSLNPLLKVSRQMTEVLELHEGVSNQEARKRSIEMLKLVGIPDAPGRFDNYPHQFSGGMRQRVMIAMALLCRPEVLLADEPTTALDVTIQAQILTLIRTLSSELGTAVILVTHDLGVVAGMARRTAVMYAGRIVEQATTAELFARPRHPYTIGLLRSLPGRRAVEAAAAAAPVAGGIVRPGRLASIPGRPPDLTKLAPGCPFAPRCPWVIEKCLVDRPTLRDVGNGSLSACWLDDPGQDTPTKPDLWQGASS